MDRCCWDESARPRYGLGGFRQQADTGRALRANGRSIRRARMRSSAQPTGSVHGAARTRLLPRPDHHPLDRSLPCQLVACVHNSTCSGHRVHDARRSEKVWSVYVPSTYGPCARSNGTPGRALSLATPMHAFSHTQRRRVEYVTRTRVRNKTCGRTPPSALQAPARRWYSTLLAMVITPQARLAQRPPPLNLFDQCKDRTHYYPANAIDP
jgi:hypothetical protein